MNWLRSTFAFVLDLFFGCRHPRLTRPFTLKDSNSTYKVCLDCGRHLEYSLEKMRLYTPWELHRLRTRAARSAAPLLVPADRPANLPANLFDEDLKDSNAAA